MTVVSVDCTGIDCVANVKAASVDWVSSVCYRCKLLVLKYVGWVNYFSRMSVLNE